MVSNMNCELRYELPCSDCRVMPKTSAAFFANGIATTAAYVLHTYMRPETADTPSPKKWPCPKSLPDGPRSTWPWMAVPRNTPGKKHWLVHLFLNQNLPGVWRGPAASGSGSSPSQIRAERLAAWVEDDVHSRWRYAVMVLSTRK